jgi:hypothetical protein
MPKLRLVAAGENHQDENSFTYIGIKELDLINSKLKRLALEARVESVKLGSDGLEFGHIARQMESLANKMDQLIGS